MLPATAGLFDASPSDKVKSAVINSDTGLTYKQFFSGYKYAKSVNWSETKIEGGRVAAAVAKVVYKNTENFKQNLQAELENRRKEEIAKLELEIHNEQALRVQRLDLYEKDFESTGHVAGLNMPPYLESVASKNTEKEFKNNGILPQRDYCGQIRCIHYPFSSNQFERDLKIEIDFRESDLSRINDIIAEHSKTLETIPASNTYRLKSAEKDLASSRQKADYLKQELRIARAVLSAYLSAYEKHLTDAKTQVRKLYADEKEKAKTFISQQNLSKLETLKKPVKEVNAGSWADLREISDTFVFVPLKNGQINYQGGETRFTWADGKTAIIPRQSRSMEAVIFQAIQSQKPIWTAPDDLPVIGYKYVESAHSSRQ